MFQKCHKIDATLPAKVLRLASMKQPLDVAKILHSKITMASDAVPYYIVTTLVLTQCCSFEVAWLLPWITHTATLLKYLRGYSKVTVELL